MPVVAAVTASTTGCLKRGLLALVRHVTVDVRLSSRSPLVFAENLTLRSSETLTWEIDIAQLPLTKADSELRIATVEAESNVPLQYTLNITQDNEDHVR